MGWGSEEGLGLAQGSSWDAVMVFAKVRDRGLGRSTKGAWRVAREPTSGSKDSARVVRVRRWSDGFQENHG